MSRPRPFPLLVPGERVRLAPEGPTYRVVRTTTSEQARADAMADAETLRRVAWTPALLSAAIAGAHAVTLMGGPGLMVSRLRSSAYRDEMAYDEGLLAARAAFRAVPGLRGA